MHVSYTEVLSNLWLMARMFFRVSITTGFALWLVVFLVARKVCGREQVRRKARVLEFPDGYKAVTSRNALRKAVR